MGAFASLEGRLLVQARVDRRDAAWTAASGNGDALSRGVTLQWVFCASEQRYYKLETDHADKGVGGEEREASLLDGIALLVLMLVVRSLVVLGVLLLLRASLVSVTAPVIAIASMTAVVAARVFVKVVILSIILLSLFPVCVALLPVIAAKSARLPIVSVGVARVGPIVVREVLLAEIIMICLLFCLMLRVSVTRLVIKRLELLV